LEIRLPLSGAVFPGEAPKRGQKENWKIKMMSIKSLIKIYLEEVPYD